MDSHSICTLWLEADGCMLLSSRNLLDRNLPRFLYRWMCKLRGQNVGYAFNCFWDAKISWTVNGIWNPQITMLPMPARTSLRRTGHRVTHQVVKVFFYDYSWSFNVFYQKKYLLLIYNLLLSANFTESGNMYIVILASL